MSGPTFPQGGGGGSSWFDSDRAAAQHITDLIEQSKATVDQLSKLQYRMHTDEIRLENLRRDVEEDYSFLHALDWRMWILTGWSLGNTVAAVWLAVS